MINSNAKHDSVIFDLDGTIWDSRKAVAWARNLVVKEFGLSLPEYSVEDVQKTMGLTTDKVYEIAFASLSPQQREELKPRIDAEIAKTIRSGQGVCLFPQVRQTLRILGLHYKMYLVSNCSRNYLAAYFAWSGDKELFKDSLCYGENLLPKSENIRLIVERNGLLNPVYVGDTAGDQAAAKTANVPYIHADYGFGQPSEECVHIQSFSELLSFFRS